MHNHHSPRARALPRFRLSLLAAGLLACGASQAIDFGPFSLNGFAKVEVQRGSNNCSECQRFPLEDRQRFWADETVAGAPYGTKTTHVTLVQPYLGAKFDLGRGFKLSGLISQRWRDGELDIPGSYYDKSIAVSHEDYGRLTIGSMTSRSWSLADYPYGSDIGVSDSWASSGAGYAMLGHAVRYTSRIFDFAEGDLVLEATFDNGASGWKRNDPWFIELYAQYIRGDLHLDAIYQESRNGQPVAWGHAPFRGLTPNPADDRLLGGSGQSIAMLMARYQINKSFKVFGGARLNRWSGAYAVIVVPGASAQWNNMFNVNWGGTRDGIPNPGYSATSTDVSAGLTYTTGQWTASTGMVVLGQASTNNPSERGQSNSVVINSLGLNYDFRNGLQVYGLAGMVNFSEKGLAPLSMPGNSAFTGVDPRVSKHGNWFGVGAVYSF